MTIHTDSTIEEAGLETCLIVHPVLESAEDVRALDDVLEEVEGLARAIHLDVCATLDVNLKRISAGYFLSKGLRERVRDAVEENDPGLVIVNSTLSPVQQRNLEREWNRKVIDRTGLILEIFGERAETKEGRLQVELAAQEYQRSRLVRSWTHLERQRGGAGFMGGPGERQIELDRRIIGERIKALKKQLDDVRRTRELGRKSREQVPFPVVALVGYTNAGKSTLFNRLTDAGVYAEDLPFATLDPTLRRITMPSGQEVILSDTVGFIADLPTHLVAAFRATLEQTVHADVLIHLIDVSRPDYEAQKADVIAVLEDLGIDYENDVRVVEVYNKMDALKDEEARAEIERLCNLSDRVCNISAVQGQGVDGLLAAISDVLTRDRVLYEIVVPFADGAALSWLYSHGEVMTRTETEKGVRVEIELDESNLGKFVSKFGYAADKM